MITVAAIMLAGIIAGYLVKNHKRFIGVSSRLTLWVIYLLLFFLGVAIGNNDYIMHHLHGLGITALVITLAAVAGSLATSWILWIFVFKARKEQV
jgi:uncharacterized membrane protein YbjE (DUF340 family)